jgi:hypothetical protein
MPMITMFLTTSGANVVEHGTGLHVQRQQVRVDCRHEQALAEHGESAIHWAAAVVQVVRQLAAIAPDLSPGARVDRPRIVVEPGEVDDTVDHDRRCLKGAEHAGLKRPLRRELIDVGGRDLREWTVAMAVVIARVGEPARGILEAGEQILIRHSGRAALLRGERGGAQHDHQYSAHRVSPTDRTRAACRAAS